jgi:DNA-binding HxlR family transcriptional regulator
MGRMRWDTLSKEDCSLSRTLAVIGDRWTLLILRDAFLRVRRFEEFETSLKIARRVLSERLALLVDEDIFKKVPYQAKPVRFEYRLTQKGLDLYPAILHMVHWGDKHVPTKAGPPVVHTHVACGHDFRAVLSCSQCGAAVGARDVAARSTRAGPSRSRKAATR